MTKTDTLQMIDAAFRLIKKHYDERYASRDELICKQGFYKNCSVLKLQKASWTNDSMDKIQNTSGIFFSIWVTEKSASESKANYNIHALKLRELKGYSITSRNFADEFRKNFTPMKKAWPNLSMDYGPLTLVEGWFEVDLNRLEENILPLMERFKRISMLIDRLLAKRAR
ncbi:MAG TPA: hypothetical protein VGF44_00300 [Terriglobales bacterium]|jgi:hypothetical protein